ncbi:MAG: protein kinase [Deltaproteobacteria bacterium]|nr:protein kinase [Deltaproteobacteria bacterium]
MFTSTLAGVSEDNLPADFGKYRLTRRIATGGMAEIFLAHPIAAPSELLVIKRILPHLAKEAGDFLSMFLDEARIASQLNHENVVRIEDVGQIDGAYYIAMEYVHGEDIRRIFNRAFKLQRSLPLSHSIRVVADAGIGLGYAHKLKDLTGRPVGLVHRDVSPQNIIVGYDGQVKIVDFGIAKAAGKVTQTRAGVLKGKYSYMSPEQAVGDGIDHRTDIFALGIILYETTTGTRLFKRHNELATLQAIIKCEFAPPSDVLPGYPPGLERALMKALAKDPADRYAHAEDFSAALNEFTRSTGLYVERSKIAEFLAELFNDRLAAESGTGGPVLPKEQELREELAQPGGAKPDPTASPLAARVSADEVSGLADTTPSHRSLRVDSDPHSLDGSKPEVGSHDSSPPRRASTRPIRPGSGPRPDHEPGVEKHDGRAQAEPGRASRGTDIDAGRERSTSGASGPAEDAVDDPDARPTEYAHPSFRPSHPEGRSLGPRKLGDATARALSATGQEPGGSEGSISVSGVSERLHTIEPANLPNKDERRRHARRFEVTERDVETVDGSGRQATGRVVFWGGLLLVGLALLAVLAGFVVASFGRPSPDRGRLEGTSRVEDVEAPSGDDGTPSVSGTAVIQVMTEPGAEVFFGGTALGLASEDGRFGPVEVPSGDVELRVANSAIGFERRRMVTVRGGGNYSFEIPGRVGWVRLEVSPSTAVMVDGKRFGLTPLPPLKLFEGVHEIRLENAQMGRWRVLSVLVSAGQEHEIRVNLDETGHPL